MNGKSLIAILIFISCVGWQQEARPLVIAAKGHNVRPQVAAGSAQRTYAIAWVQTDDVATLDNAAVMAAILVDSPSLAVSHKLSISRPSAKKLKAPYAAVAYHPRSDRYYLAWQEIFDGSDAVFLRAVSGDGSEMSQPSLLGTDRGTLLSPLLLAIDPQGDRVLAAMSTCRSNGLVGTALISFDVTNPGGPPTARLLGDVNQGQFGLSGALLPAGDTFRLYQYILRENNGKGCLLLSRSIDGSTTLENGSDYLTKQKVRRSRVLSAAEAYEQGEALILANRTNNGFSKSLLVLMHQDAGGAATGPPLPITDKNAFIPEAALTAAAADGLNYLLYLVEESGGWELLLQGVTEAGELVGGPIRIDQSDLAIGDAAVALATDGSSALVAWCRDTQDGAVRLLARTVSLQ